MAVIRTLLSAGKFAVKGAAKGAAELALSRSHAGRTALAVAALMGRATPLGRAFLLYEVGRAAYDWRREYKKAKALQKSLRAEKAGAGLPVQYEVVLPAQTS